MDHTKLADLRNRVIDRIASHALIKRVHSRSMTRDQYACYVNDVYHYAKHSSCVIGSAAVRLVHSNPPLSEYLFRHAAEEIGHDAWARSDLLDLGWTNADIDASKSSEACQRMIALEYFYACTDNPVGLFGWMYVLECLGGGIGGTMAQAVDAALDLRGKGTYFLSGHGDADILHSKDLTDMISTNVTSARDCADLLHVAWLSLDCYVGILDAASAVSLQPSRLSA